MFFEFGIKDFIDILLVAFVLYYTYKLMKASGFIKVFTGILVFILIWLVVTQVLEMKLLGSIFNFSVIRTASTASRTSCTRRICAPFINATVSNTVVPFNESCGVPPNNL